MDPHRTAARLDSLTRFEIDCIKAYDLAIRHLDAPAVRDEVYRMKADVERHVLENSEVLRALGQEPPSFDRDLKGYVMACVTALRSASGSDGAVRAVSAIGYALVERFEDAMAWDVPLEVRIMFQSNQADVRRHLDQLVIETAPAVPAGR
ncbi:MAG: hypothetical protein H0W83_14220 [Planctomycetes bacterium]|nr:hypothetical protein [Planctomycetota bacterium]